MADPGFPRGGAPTYNFAKFSPKLHETERIWTPGGARVPRAPLDPSMKLAHFTRNFFTFSFHYNLGPVVIPFV